MSSEEPPPNNESSSTQPKKKKNLLNNLPKQISKTIVNTTKKIEEEISNLPSTTQKVVSTASKGASTAAKGASKAAKGIARVPQQIGKTVLSVPNHVKNVGGKKKKKTTEGDVDEITAKLDFINQELLADQDRRKIVRESTSQCMGQMQTHLGEYLVGNPTSTYEDWIASLHPDNVKETKEEDEDGVHKIDHRFYVEGSDHRELWNQYMNDLGFVDRIVEAKYSSHNDVADITR